MKWSFAKYTQYKIINFSLEILDYEIFTCHQITKNELLRNRNFIVM